MRLCNRQTSFHNSRSHHGLVAIRLLSEVKYYCASSVVWYCMIWYCVIWYCVIWYCDMVLGGTGSPSAFWIFLGLGLWPLTRKGRWAHVRVAGPRPQRQICAWCRVEPRDSSSGIGDPWDEGRHDELGRRRMMEFLQYAGRECRTLRIIS